MFIRVSTFVLRVVLLAHVPAALAGRHGHGMHYAGNSALVPSGAAKRGRAGEGSDYSTRE